MALTVTLYFNSADPYVIDKSAYLSGEFSCNATEHLDPAQGIMDASIILSSAAPYQQNYVYIKEWQRYYFINKPTWIGGNNWRYDLIEDVLMSHKTKIMALSGYVDYSSAGSSALYDPRLVYDTEKTRTRYTKPIHNSGYYGLGTSAYAMTIMTPNFETVYLFNLTQLTTFTNNFWNLEEADRIAAGKMIRGIYEIPYYGIMSDAQSADVVISTPGKNITINCGTIPKFWSSSSYRPIGSNENLVTEVSFTISPGNTYADLTADYNITIPYIGTLSFTPANMGISDISAVGVNILTELGGMTLSMYPTINGVKFENLIKSTPITTGLPFTVDTNIANWDMFWNNIPSAVGGIAVSTASSIASGAILGGGAAGAVIGGLSAGLNIYGTATSLFNQYEQKKIAEEIGFSNISATVGGSPSKLASDLYGVTGNLTAWLDVYKKTPKNSNIQSNFGKPDGQYRALSSLSGYFKMGNNFKMGGFNSAYKDEIDRIETLLKSGVYVS